MFDMIARPSYDFHVNAYENEQHRRLVAARNARDLAMLQRMGRAR